MKTLLDLDALQVRNAMTTVTLTAAPSQKMEEVARLFQEFDIGSAPVVDEVGKCIGIITSSDLVRFQSEWSDVAAQIDHGMEFDVNERAKDGSIELVPRPYDLVQRQMTSAVQTIEQSASLRMATKIMCAQHIHHLVVLDNSRVPVGILSSLDILAKLNG
jgi:CBS domain-containing protein